MNIYKILYKFIFYYYSYMFFNSTKYNKLLENSNIKYKKQTKKDVYQISFITKLIIKKNNIKL